MNLKFNIKDIIYRSVDLINLPSEGKFYDHKTASLRIRHLSGLEEMLLTNDFLNKSGDALYLTLENLILDDIPIKDLILPDLQGIMMFLYATAFGDKLPLSVKCPSCNHEYEFPLKLSSLEFKKTNYQPNNGKFYFYIPYDKKFHKYNMKAIQEDDKYFLEFVVKPPTFGEQLDATKKGLDINNSTNKVILNIESIGGIYDKSIITIFVKSLTLPLFKEIKNFIKKNEVGVEDKISTTCPLCNSTNPYHVSLGHDFLKFPESHKQNVLEECFLLSHYSLGSMSFDRAKELPTLERRWAMNRLQEELHKKQEAEEKAYKAAKAKHPGGRRKV